MTTALPLPSLPMEWRTPEFLTGLKAVAILDELTPDPVGPPSCRARYVARDTAPRSARRGAALAVRTWGMDADTVDKAMLVVSELVTNAISHTASRVVSMSVTRTAAATVRISVGDSARGPLSPPVSPDGDEEHGRGLLLVAALADRWGIEQTSSGKQVWCELDVEQVQP
ncbi:ATP-binding protein (plasmid) [Streptomyces sp. NBC_01724]|uniref:ATP-binding protein n=1 Tax=Streptomyces sp. NBC_01724 TaxID=2975922 RepID=UPI002E349333|nr:ATP-binding protein [Streptomyces sp. NBC_01724]